MSDWWDGMTCSRKRRYPSYKQAKEVLTEMRESGRAAPTLHVYSCPMVRGSSESHFHLGNATGREARRLLKRAEKQRRKALVRDASEVTADV